MDRAPRLQEKINASAVPSTHMTKYCTALLSALLLSGSACVHVKIDAEGQSVDVVRTIEEVAGCREISKVGAKTASKIGFIARDERKLALELERLARNEAGRAGGNTIVPLGPITNDGRRQYGNYVCPSSAD